jgi:hypothetical protein
MSIGFTARGGRASPPQLADGSSMILTCFGFVLLAGQGAMTKAQLEARSRKFLLGLRETQKRQLREHREIARLNRLLDPGERIEPDLEQRRFATQAMALTTPEALHNAPLEELLQIMEHLRDFAVKFVKKRTVH